MDDEVREKCGVLRMLLEDYLRCSGGLAKQATGRKPVVWALCTHRPGGASVIHIYKQQRTEKSSRLSTPMHPSFPSLCGENHSGVSCFPDWHYIRPKVGGVSAKVSLYHFVSLCRILFARTSKQSIHDGGQQQSKGPWRQHGCT
jgi:hypothetical protein